MGGSHETEGLHSIKAKASSSRIMRCIVEPYRRNYGEMHPDMVDDLMEDLAGFSEETLEAAWREVRQNVTSKPKIAHIITACRQAETRKSSGGDGNSAAQKLIHELNAKAHRALERCNQFVREYIKESPVFAEARRSGYEAKVLGYVQAAAFYQAQVIEGVKNKGIDWLDLFDWKMPEFREMRELQERFNQQAATGEIGVEIPTKFLDGWKQDAQLRKQKEAA